MSMTSRIYSNGTQRDGERRAHGRSASQRTDAYPRLSRRPGPALV